MHIETYAVAPTTYYFITDCIANPSITVNCLYLYDQWSLEQMWKMLALWNCYKCFHYRDHGHVRDGDHDRYRDRDRDRDRVRDRDRDLNLYISVKSH